MIAPATSRRWLKWVLPAGFLMVLLGVLYLQGPTAMAGLFLVLLVGLSLVSRMPVLLAGIIVALPMRGWLAGGERLVVGGLDFDLGGLVSVILVGLAAGHFILRRRLPVIRGRIAVPYLAMLLLFVISTAWSPDPRQGVRIVMRLAAPFAIYLLIADLAQRRWINWERLVLLSAVIPLVVAVFELATGQGSTITRGFVRVDSCFVHPAVLSMFLLFVFCLAYSEFLGGSVHRRPVLVALLGLVVALLLATYTRISWMAATVAFLYLSAVYRRPRYVAFATLVLVLMVLWAGSSIFERVTQVGTILTDQDLLDDRGNSIGWRLIFWRALLEDWWTAPIIGHGAGSSIAFGHQLMGVYSSPHNGFLRVLYETGVVGACVFVWLLLKTLRMALSTPGRRAHLLVAVVTAYVVVNLTDNILEYYEVTTFLWGLAALVEADRFAPRTLATTPGQPLQTAHPGAHTPHSQ